MGGRYEDEYLSKAENLLDSLQARVTPRTILQGALLTSMLAGLLAYLLFESLVPAFLLAIFSTVLPLTYLNALDRKRKRRFLEQLPELIAQVRTAVACGYTLPMALSIAQRQLPSPMSQELRVVQGHMRLGMPLADALARLQRRMPGDDLDLLIGAITLAERSGGQLGKILLNIEQTVRDRLRLERKLRALTARGKMESALIAIGPFLLGGMLYLIQPDLMRRFVTHPSGPWWLVGSVVWMSIGFMIIRKILTPQF